jgi:hypothetical protein
LFDDRFSPVALREVWRTHNILRKAYDCRLVDPDIEALTE